MIASRTIRTSLNRPNGIYSSYQYDSLSRLLSVLHNGVGDGAGYGYDLAGNRTSKQNFQTNVTENYSYDALYQLTQVVKGATVSESYGYDAAGNRLSSLGVSPWSYNSSNQLTGNPTATFTYDQNGNMLSKITTSGVNSYTWDYENRLASATVPGTSGGTSTSVTFRYDPFGRRVQKASGSGVTNYLYDGANIVAELSASGGILASYAQGAGIDEPLAMKRSGYVGYYEADGLGSVTSLTGSNGAMIASYAYDSFGQTTPTEGLFNPFRYTGREQDPETGLYYYRARYYDPQIGRFISEDPLRFRGSGTNFYSYVRNGPTGYIDPTGLVCFRCALANYEADDKIAQLTNDVFYNFSRFPNQPGLLELALVHQLAKASEIVDAAAIGNMSNDAAEKSLTPIQWVAEFPPAIAAVITEFAASQLKGLPNDQIVEGLESYRDKLQKAIDMPLGMAAQEERNAACQQ